MRKTLILSLLVAASTSITALADTITLVGTPSFGPYSAGQAGEFTVIPGGFGVSGYVPGVTSDLVQSGSFQTFCVEETEHIFAGGTYNVTPNTVTVATGFTLFKGAAYLYQQFAAGTLSGYDYTPAGRLASAAALQQELWHLMGNQSPANSIFDPIVNAAATAGGWAVNGVNDTPVLVLNVWRLDLVGERQGRSEFQDLLYIPGTSVPDGGLTLALLGMGLTGLGVISRRVRK